MIRSNGNIAPLRTEEQPGTRWNSIRRAGSHIDVVNPGRGKPKSSEQVHKGVFTAFDGAGSPEPPGIGTPPILNGKIQSQHISVINFPDITSASIQPGSAEAVLVTNKKGISKRKSGFIVFLLHP